MSINAVGEGMEPELLMEIQEGQIAQQELSVVELMRQIVVNSSPTTAQSTASNTASSSEETSSQNPIDGLSHDDLQQQIVSQQLAMQLAIDEGTAVNDMGMGTQSNVTITA